MNPGDILLFKGEGGMSWAYTVGLLLLWVM